MDQQKQTHLNESYDFKSDASLLKQAIQSAEAEIQFSLKENLDFAKEATRSEIMKTRLATLIESQPPNLRLRIEDEIQGIGPLAPYIKDEQITEILINGPDSIWVERAGKLQPVPDQFFSQVSYLRFLNMVCDQADIHLSIDRPYASGRWNQFRVQIVGKELAVTSTIVSLRKHPKNPWSLESLASAGWCSASEAEWLKKVVHQGANLLVIGNTGTGKTSALNALISCLPPAERTLVIEDTEELHIPTGAGLRLLARNHPSSLVSVIDQAELVRQALRLRPDRIVMGEIRGGEAKDLILALSTGHRGSLATMHANGPHQALTRLEMLVQLGAPNWNLSAVRRMIQLGMEYIIQVERTSEGHRRLKAIYKLVSLEENGFLIEPVQP